MRTEGLEMMISRLVLVPLMLAQAMAAADDDAAPPLVEDTMFPLIENRQDEARQWAMCSATFRATSEVFDGENQGMAKQLRELGNGAQLATTMSLVMKGLDSDITPEKFSSLWNSAKHFGESLPESAYTQILSLAEHDADGTLKRLNSTMAICMQNQVSQKAYIDTWREMMLEGILK